MFFAALFYVIAFLFAGAASASSRMGFPGHGISAALLYYAAFANLATGSLYLASSLFGINPARLFKDNRGERKRLASLLIGPYLMFEYWGWRRYRERTREPLFEPVAPGLCLGGRPDVDDVAPVREAGINVVLDLVAEFPDPLFLRNGEGMVYLSIPVLDGCSPSKGDVIQAVRFVTAAREAGKTVLVHCTFGHGRSAMVMAAVLMATGEAAGPDEALAVLSGLKRRIWLTREQKKVLRSYHQDLVKQERKKGGGQT